jgi:hypothetical protein
MSHDVNCYADFRFQVDVKTPNSRGVLATPAAGAVTGLQLRLAGTKDGAALDPIVDNLLAIETVDQPGRFYYDADTALLQVYVLAPLGQNATFWAIWSKPGDLDFYARRFRAVIGTRIK